MVHALREAHRVLKPREQLVDLRPADRDTQVLSMARQASRLLGRIPVDEYWSSHLDDGRLKFTRYGL